MKESFNDDTSFSSKLIDWYKENKRDLPWRETTDPYKIWLSEIILQQTRVSQGLEYYQRITERFRDVRSLAEAEEDEVLKYWQGLGYYSRARNLHATAKTILSQYNGVMPTDYDTLLKLKGIGEYTAAAIASFTTNSPHPVVDGNVFRFLSRYLAISEPINSTKSKKIFTEIAYQLMDKKRPALFNQAIMEFGALQCTPGLPDCTTCPFVSGCLAKNENRIEAYPVKQDKLKSRTRYFHYFHIVWGEYTFLRKRNGQDIWGKLYEFPMIETQEATDFADLQKNDSFLRLFDRTEASDFRMRVAGKKHILSHRILYVNFYEVKINVINGQIKIFIQVKENELVKYPVHRLMDDYIQNRYQEEINSTKRL